MWEEERRKHNFKHFSNYFNCKIDHHHHDHQFRFRLSYATVSAIYANMYVWDTTQRYMVTHILWQNLNSIDGISIWTAWTLYIYFSLELSLSLQELSPPPIHGKYRWFSHYSRCSRVYILLKQCCDCLWELPTGVVSIRVERFVCVLLLHISETHFWIL